MGYFQDLFSISGKLNIFSIFLTASILTIFEIVFFYSVIVPDVNYKLDSTFQSLEEYVSELSNKEREPVLKLFEDTLYGKFKKFISGNNSSKINSNSRVNENSRVNSNSRLNENSRVNSNSRVNEKFSNKNADIISEIDENIENLLSTLVDRENELIEKNNSNTIVVSVTILLFLSFFILSAILSIKNDANYTGSKIFIEPLIVAFITVGLLIGFQVLFYNFGLNFIYPSNNETLKIAVDSLELD